MGKGAFVVSKGRSTEHSIEEISIYPNMPESEIPPEQMELVPLFLSVDEVIRIYYI